MLFSHFLLIRKSRLIASAWFLFRFIISDGKTGSGKDEADVLGVLAHMRADVLEESGEGEGGGSPGEASLDHSGNDNGMDKDNRT